MKIAYHAINGVGLGHLARLFSIAVAVDSRAPAQQLFVTSSRSPETVIGSRFPSVRILDTPDAPNLGKDQITMLVQNTICEFRPDAVVFDMHFSRSIVRAIAPSICCILVLRLCKPEYIDDLQRAGLLGLFDEIIFAEDFEVVKKYMGGCVELLAELNVRFVGGIVRPEIYARQSTAKDGTILVTGGGGGLKEQHSIFFERALGAAKEVARKTRRRVVIVPGPYSDLHIPNEDAVLWSPKGALYERMASADLVVSCCGYNTCNELLAVGASFVAVSLEHRFEDQAMRCAYLSAEYGVPVLPYQAELSRYVKAIEVGLRRPGREPVIFSGAERAAEEICRLARAQSTAISL